MGEFVSAKSVTVPAGIVTIYVFPSASGSVGVKVKVSS